MLLGFIELPESVDSCLWAITEKFGAIIFSNIICTKFSLFFWNSGWKSVRLSFSSLCLIASFVNLTHCLSVPGCPRIISLGLSSRLLLLSPAVSDLPLHLSGELFIFIVHFHVICAVLFQVAWLFWGICVLCSCFWFLLFFFFFF